MQVFKPNSSAADARRYRDDVANALRTKSRKNKAIRAANLRRIESGNVGPITKAYIAAGKRFPGQRGYSKRAFAPPTADAIMRAYLGLGDTKVYDTIHTAFAPITMVASTDTPVATSAGNWYYQGGAVPSSAILLNPVNQAATASARLGRTISMQALRLRGSIQASNSAASVIACSQQVALALVYINDVNNASALPPQNEVFQSQNALTLTNRDNTGQYRILRKWDYNLNGDRDLAGDRTDNSSIFFDEYIQLKGLESMWSASVQTGGYDSMEKGGLCLYVRGMLPAATSAQNVFVVARLYFKDV